MDDRKNEEYRRHTLLAVLHEGVYRGRAWKDKNLVIELVGSGLDDVLIQLKERIDTAIADRAVEKPSKSEYVSAFRGILGSLSDGHLAMLRAHYRAPNRRITATQLAEAAGYQGGYSSANLQYGNVGKMLYEQHPMLLRKREDGSLVYTSALADSGAHSGPEENWEWQMRPEVADALEELGLHRNA